MIISCVGAWVLGKLIVGVSIRGSWFEETEPRRRRMYRAIFAK